MRRRELRIDAAREAAIASFPEGTVAGDSSSGDIQEKDGAETPPVEWVERRRTREEQPVYVSQEKHEARL